MISCVDTSAAVKRLVQEDESDPLTAFPQAGRAHDLVAGGLLHTELHRTARRHPDAVDPDDDLAGAARAAGLVVVAPR